MLESRSRTQKTRIRLRSLFKLWTTISARWIRG